MECYVLNGELHPVENGMTITSMLQKQSIDANTGVAIAINSQVIPKQNWENQKIQSNDSVLIITATQGG
ncbi:MAG: sulfur carrier protein ThiS [bacterium]|nr:sulfur carrier protein ThiS [bacterium]